MAKNEMAQYVPDNSMLELVKENLGGELDLSMIDRIRIPTGGGKLFMVPSMEGEQAQKEIEGVLIYYTFQNVYWAKGIEEGSGEPPDCVARDGKIGVGIPGGACVSCPLNQWGSKFPEDETDNRKACRNTMLLYIQTAGKMLPTTLLLPPTSMPAMKKYLYDLTVSGRPYSAVVSKWGLVQDKTDKGIVYSKGVPEKVRDLNAEEYNDISAFRGMLLPVLKGAEPFFDV